MRLSEATGICTSDDMHVQTDLHACVGNMGLYVREKSTNTHNGLDFAPHLERNWISTSSSWQTWAMLTCADFGASQFSHLHLASIASRRMQFTLAQHEIFRLSMYAHTEQTTLLCSKVYFKLMAAKTSLLGD